MRWIHLFAILLAIGHLTHRSHAEITLEASIQNNVLRVGERTHLVLTVTTDQNDDLTQPQIPEIEGLQIVYYGQSQQQKMFFDGRSMQQTRSLELQYIVTALAEGTWTVDSIQVPSRAGMVKAPPFTITVLAANAPQPTPQPGEVPSPKSDTYGVVFVLQPDKNEAYVGEEIHMLCKAYIPANRGIQPQKLDDRSGQFQGFWTEIFDMTDTKYQRQVYLNTSNGRLLYYEIPLKKYMLYPLKAGTQTIEPLTLVCQIPIRSQSSGFGMLLGRMTSFSVLTEPVTIKVNPLPEENRPDSFKGAVGSSYKLHSHVDSTEIKEGNTVSLTVTLEGFGNLRNIAAPILPDLSKFEQYEPTKKDNIHTSENGVSGRIEYTYPLIPHDVNSKEIGPVRFAYFDPNQKQYVTLQTEPIQLTILPMGLNGMRGGGAMGGNRRMIRRVGEDFRFNVVSPLALSSVFLPIYKKPKFRFLFLAPMAFLISAFLWKKRLDYYADNPDRLKRKRAPRQAGKLLAQARNALRQGNTERLYAALAKAITDYIDNRWNVASQGFTADELRRLLLEKGISPDCAHLVVQSLDEFDGARFSGEERTRELQQRDFSKAEQMLAALMKQKTVS
jgi:hypothetical protein